MSDRLHKKTSGQKNAKDNYDSLFDICLPNDATIDAKRCFINAFNKSLLYEASIDSIDNIY